MVEILATGLVYIPSGLLTNSHRDAYLALFGSTLFSLPAVWIIGSLCEKRPQARALTLFTEFLGKPLGTLIALIYAVFVFITELSIIAPGSVMINSAFMPETPVIVIVLLLTILAGYAAYLGLESLSRFNIFIIPLMILTFIVIGITNVKNFNFVQLLPPLEHGLNPVSRGIIAPIGWCDQIMLALIFAPEVRNISKRSLFWVVIICALVFEYLVIIILLTMGPILPTYYEFPTLELTRTATVGGSIHGYDALIMIVWVTAVSLKGAVWIYAGIILMGDIFKLQHRQSLLAPLVIALTFMAYPGVDNSRELTYYGSYIWPQLAVPIFEVGIPLLLYLLFLLKQHKANSPRKR